MDNKTNNIAFSDAKVEILEFKLGNEFYGMEISKIREIISYQDVTPVPNAHPSVEGVFMPRETMITAIDLKNAIQSCGDYQDNGLFIIASFNDLDIAFHVDCISGIHRINANDIMIPDAMINNDLNGIISGVVKFEDRLIIMLDFEKIITDISPISVEVA